ncbi:MAG: hypothetical protein NXI31_18135 [bacterium]|nr:hypothetical protein [bacterium]
MGWTERDLRTIGFFANRRRRSPFGVAGRKFTIAGVELIASVSGCIAEWPDDWIDHWLHNELWLYDSLDILESILPSTERERFIRYSVAALPVQFRNGEPVAFPVERVRPAATPAGFVRLGFDTCSRTAGTKFECSPAICGAPGAAAKLGANRYGLFDSLAGAIDVARTRRDGTDEPGPYAVLEIRAECDPLAPDSSRT